MADVQIAPSPPPVPRSQPQSTKSTPRTSAKALVSVNGNDSNLPDLRHADQVIDRSKPLPTSLQSDFLPDDVLFALTQPPPAQEQLGPVTRSRNLAVTGVPARKPPNNVWNHKRRDKFKHLIDKTACACGAGKDISFLYDIPQKEEYPGPPDSVDESMSRRPDTEPKVLALPDTLIPEEYHIVRNKGVMGLEYNEDKYACQAKDHEKHLVSFPSMKPTSRFEVLQLKKTLDNMLEKAGVDDLDLEVKGPTQMHNLLELIKKEQNIYNIIFHEMIRQVSVECIERGQLLSDLREKYSDLLNRVPRQIKSLHEEVMAQRALDRRLTEELMRFRSTIGQLTSELTEVKEHDKQVTSEAEKAQEDLKSALAESQKNASLLAEYHDLYELQRKRLEKLVNTLSEEREIWSTAAYSLALKVTQEKDLNTAKRLHVSEKTWSKLASHFAILLSDQDTIVLTQLQGHVDSWREMLEIFIRKLNQNETEMTRALRGIRDDLQMYRLYFQSKIILTKPNKDGQFVRLPKSSRIKEIHTDLQKWTKSMQNEVEKFSGDSMLSGEEMLGKVKVEMDGWTECALTVFGRHKEGGKTYSETGTMNTLNTSIHELLKQLHVRNDGENAKDINTNMHDLADEMLTQLKVAVLGENGVARALIQLSNSFEAWDMKLTQASMGTPIAERDWQVFYELLDDWTMNVDAALALIGTTQKEEEREKKTPHAKVDIAEVFRMSQKWLTATTNGIDSEDGKLVEQVTSLHTEMVKWMVQILLRLAPDLETNSLEVREAALLGSATVPQIQEKAKSLSMEIEKFSTFVVACCGGIVNDRMQKKMDNMDEDADLEYRDLKRLKVECDEWVFTSKLLICELTGESPLGLGKPPKEGTEWDSRPTTQQSAMLYHDKEKLQKPTDATAAPSVPEPIPEQEPVESVQPPAADNITQEETPAETSQQVPDSADEAQPPEVATGDEQMAAAADDQSKQTDAGEQQEEKLDDVEPELAETEPEPGLFQFTYTEMTQRKFEVIGFDSNTHIKQLKEVIPSDITTKPVSPPPMALGEGRAETPNTKRAFEALASVNDLQIQLLDAEERANLAEDKAAQLDTQLREALEKVRSLERTLANEDRKDPFDAMRPKSPQPDKVAAPGAEEQDPKAQEPEQQKGKKKGGKASAKKRK